ncbi:MAG: hypothetical protein OXE86_18795 [Alphaproteobacteria bacterium]|nr:hypothetical protein [Alphaproteobacteria bacterium]
MPINFSVNNVKKAAIDAMVQAGREYNTEWTEGRVGTVRAFAPELFYQVKVAEGIRGLPFRPAVFLEYNARHALEYNAKHADPPNPEPLPGIFAGEGSINIDILVARKKRKANFQPFQIALEIKRSASNWRRIEADVLRLSELVRSTGFRMGLSLFITRSFVGEEGPDLENLKAAMEKYSEANPDLRLSLIDPKEGGERRSVRRDNGNIQCHAWYVSGVDIRLTPKKGENGGVSGGITATSNVTLGTYQKLTPGVDVVSLAAAHCNQPADCNMAV